MILDIVLLNFKQTCLLNVIRVVYASLQDFDAKSSDVEYTLNK